MSNTFSQLYIHIVFGVQYRKNLITEEFRPALEHHISALTESKGCRPLTVYCNPAHVHLLVMLSVDYKVSNLNFGD